MKMLLLTSLCGVVLFGCNTLSQLEASRIKNEPFVIDNTFRYSKEETSKVRQGTKMGTIWRGEATANNYFVDQRAKTIGDIITIKITEVSQASEKATTDTGRTSAIDAGVSNLLGWEAKYPQLQPQCNSCASY